MNANLYATEFSDQLLTHRVSELRQRLRLEDRRTPAQWRELLAFVAWAGAAVATYAAAVFLAPLILMSVAVVLVLPGSIRK